MLVPVGAVRRRAPRGALAPSGTKEHPRRVNPEALVGALELERELVKTVGSGKGLTKDQKNRLKDYVSAAKAAATLP